MIWLAVKQFVGTNQNVWKWHMNNSWLRGFLCKLTHGWWVESNWSVISCVCYWQWYTGRDTCNSSRWVLPDSLFVFGTDVTILCKKLTKNGLVTHNFLVWTKNFILKQFSKWNFEFTGPIQILEFIFIYMYVVLNNWKIYWSEQSFTGFGPDDRCSLWGLLK